MTPPTPAQRMEHVIRTFIQACNDADAAAIAACFCPKGVQYSLRLHWVGAVTIGSNFAQMIREQGAFFTVDQVLTDADRCAATLEYTVFLGPQARIVRGVDWFVFEPLTWGIQEVRSYTATPIDPNMTRQELLEFDYAGRGYPTERQSLAAKE
jgi:SnoaL-like protein